MWANAALGLVLLTLEPVVERLAGTWTWNNVIEPYFLNQPAALVLAIVGGLLILLGQKKKPVISHARD
jgi:hypothetical protein